MNISDFQIHGMPLRENKETDDIFKISDPKLDKNTSQTLTSHPPLKKTVLASDINH